MNKEERRFTAAVAAMRSFLNNTSQGFGQNSSEAVAERSVAYADALLAALDKTSEKQGPLCPTKLCPIKHDSENSTTFRNLDGYCNVCGNDWPVETPWIPHDGSGMPCREDLAVVVQFRDGVCNTPKSAGCWDWTWEGDGGDIINWKPYDR